MIEELQTEIDNDNEAEAAKKYAAIEKETDELPNVVVQTSANRRAIYLAQQAGNLSAAGIACAPARTRSSARRAAGDFNVVGEKIREIAPLLQTSL